MSPPRNLPELLADLEGKVAHHRRQEQLCAEQEGVYRDRRSFHATELERVSQCFEALRAALATAMEISETATPADLAEDLGSRSRPKLTRMVARIVEDKAPSMPFGARKVAAEVNGHYGSRLRKPVDEEQVALVLKRMADSARIHRLRKGRPYHEALYSRQRPS